jgi:hypothetical protein
MPAPGGAGQATGISYGRGAVSMARKKSASVRPGIAAKVSASACASPTRASCSRGPIPTSCVGPLGKEPGTEQEESGWRLLTASCQERSERAAILCGRRAVPAAPSQDRPSGLRDPAGNIRPPAPCRRARAGPAQDRPAQSAAAVPTFRGTVPTLRDRPVRPTLPVPKIRGAVPEFRRTPPRSHPRSSFSTDPVLKPRAAVPKSQVSVPKSRLRLPWPPISPRGKSFSPQPRDSDGPRVAISPGELIAAPADLEIPARHLPRRWRWPRLISVRQ